MWFCLVFKGAHEVGNSCKFRHSALRSWASSSTVRTLVCGCRELSRKSRHPVSLCPPTCKRTWLGLTQTTLSGRGLLTVLELLSAQGGTVSVVTAIERVVAGIGFPMVPHGCSQCVQCTPAVTLSHSAEGIKRESGGCSSPLCQIHDTRFQNQANSWGAYPSYQSRPGSRFSKLPSVPACYYWVWMAT